MVAKGVPGEIGENTVVLVKVLAEMGEDQIGLNLSFQLFKKLFDGLALPRKETVSEVLKDDVFLRRPAQKCTGARAGLAFAGGGGAENDPSDAQAGMLLDEL